MNELEAKISNYFRYRKEAVAVYLFGSYAKGLEHRFSDIDIGIILNRNYKDFVKARNDYIVQLGRILRKDIHPVILNLGGEYLLRQIFLYGKCLMINDSRELAHQRMIMFAKIAEYGYYRKQIQSQLIKNIRKG
ncbi:nucleotidyltransferase domain-containing protein [bacterium]|nr:nucleotidyltransferase domain-containing protein [bacterium]